MIYFAGTLKNLRSAVDSYIKLLGEDTVVGTKGCDCRKITGDIDYLSDLIQLEYVFINKQTLTIVGDEANDYKPKDGEVPAVLIS